MGTVITRHFGFSTSCLLPSRIPFAKRERKIFDKKLFLGSWLLVPLTLCKVYIPGPPCAGRQGHMCIFRRDWAPSGYHRNYAGPTTLPSIVVVGVFVGWSWNECQARDDSYGETASLSEHSDIVTSIQALEVIKIICDLPGTYTGRLLLFDGLDGVSGVSVSTESLCPYDGLFLHKKKSTEWNIFQQHVYTFLTFLCVLVVDSRLVIDYENGNGWTPTVSSLNFWRVLQKIVVQIIKLKNRKACRLCGERPTVSFPFDYETFCNGLSTWT